MTRRSAVKWLHWTAFALMTWFFFVEPEVPGPAAGDLRSGALSTHAGMGMLLAVVALIWTVMIWRGGLLGRPGPKLKGWLRPAHRALHIALAIALPATVLSGGLAGLASDYPVTGFGIVPLNPAGWGDADLHGAAEELHELVFDLTILLVLAHAGFHIWRHLRLRDNALRIMAPKLLHRWL